MTFAVGWALKTIIYFRQLQEACKGNEAPIMPKKLQAIAFLFTVQGSVGSFFVFRTVSSFNIRKVLTLFSA